MRWAFDEAVFGTKRSASKNSTTPTGTLIRKMLRQPIPKASWVINQPPSSGPITAAVPLTAPTMPSTAARSRGAYSTCTLESICGTIIAAKPPCTMRQTSSISPLPDRQAANEARVKPATPTRNIVRRPKLSPRRPPVMSSTAKARV